MRDGCVCVRVHCAATNVNNNNNMKNIQNTTISLWFVRIGCGAILKNASNIMVEIEFLDVVLIGIQWENWASEFARIQMGLRVDFWGRNTVFCPFFFYLEERWKKWRFYRKI